MPGKLITIPLFRKSYQKLSDEELLKQFRSSGDKEVISEFFNRYVHLIYTICFPYFKDDDRTRDMVMEIFEALDKKIIKYEIHNFKSWLYRVSRNACLMSLRKDKKEISWEQIEKHRSIIVENEPHLHLDNGESEKLQILRTFLTQLKKDQRVCIELMYFKDMSYVDISSATGYSLKQVKSYIQNGKRNLRGFFDKEVFE